MIIKEIHGVAMDGEPATICLDDMGAAYFLTPDGRWQLITVKT